MRLGIEWGLHGWSHHSKLTSSDTWKGRISDVLFATILVVRIVTFIQLRRRFGLTQAQLARKLGVHRVTVTNWERGAAGIPGPVARLLRRLDADRRAKKRVR